MQLRQLAVTADQRCQPLLGSHFQAVAPGRTTGNPVYDNWLALAPDLDRAEPFRAHFAGDRLIRVLGNHDGPRLGHGLHPRRQMDDIAVGGIIHPQIIADPADNHRSGVQPDPQPHRVAMPVLDLSIITADRLLDC